MFSPDVNKLVGLYTQQDFSALPASRPSDFISACRLFPNEVAYIIEGRTAEVEVINKMEDKVFKTRGFSIKNFEGLYEQVSPDHLDSFFGLSYNMVRLNTDGIISLNSKRPEEDNYITIYKSRTGRMIMRRSFALSVNLKGALEYTGGFLSDVTDLFQIRRFHYYFEGRNSQIIAANINGMSEFLNILSKREIEVLELIGKGFGSRKIANVLNISFHTVNTHRANIIRSLEASNAIEAYNKAVNMGLMIWK